MVTHPTLIRGLNLRGVGPSPTILQRIDQNFLPGILSDLQRDDDLAKLSASVANTRSDAHTLKLFQPIHQTFHVAVFETCCDTTGFPRLDPKRIVSAGMVIRRRPFSASGQPTSSGWEGWMQSGESFRGWVGFRDQKAEKQDPDPAFRPPALSAGHSYINHILAQRLNLETLSESIMPLFVAPPDVINATGKTILYGLISTTSSEFNDQPPPLPNYSSNALAILKNHVPVFLKAGRHYTVPRAGETLTHDALTDSTHGEFSEFTDFVTMLRQLTVEFDAFGSSPESMELFEELNRIHLPFFGSSSSKVQEGRHESRGLLMGLEGLKIPVHYRPAGVFLQEANSVFVAADGIDGPTPPSITMPIQWPVLDSSQANHVFSRIQGTLNAQYRHLTSKEGRYENLNSQYQLQAFVRVKHSPDCPAEIIWSPSSEIFTIAPWYDNNGAPPVKIALPDATDRNLLKSLKPNVAFGVPENLFNLLQKADLGDLVDGKKPGGGGIALDWICSFSLPIITFCAFLVLNIFLKLFDIVFSWMAYIKICIPIPKKQ